MKDSENSEQRKQSPFPVETEVASGQSESRRIPDDPESYMGTELEKLSMDLTISEPGIDQIEPLAKGGTGEIFTGHDASLGRIIALKTLRPENRYDSDQIERLIREAKATAQLEHPNIVPIHSIGVSPSKGVYFTMKRLRGETLRHIITQLGQRNPAYTTVYTPHVRMSIFMKICHGINYAHSKRIIHRDLKPENILIGNYGEVTIIDWGLVKKMESESSSLLPRRYHGEKDHGTRYGKTMNSAVEATAVSLPPGNLTRHGQLNGTPRFMSPEQILGDVTAIDTRTDIYSLGIILYELLTCENPFCNVYEEEDILQAVVHGNYRRPRQMTLGRQVSPELEAICLKAMSLNKEDRYQAVGELMKDVNAHQEGRPVSAYHAPWYVRMMKLCKRNPIRSSVLFGGLAAFLIIAGTTRIVDMYVIRRTMKQVEASVKQGMQQLAQLEARLIRSEALKKKASSSEWSDGNVMTQEEYDEAATGIDNLFDEGRLLLSMLTGIKGMPRQRVREWQERIMTAQMSYCLRNGRFHELRKHYGTMKMMFDKDMSNCSPDMKILLKEVEERLSGIGTLTIETVPSDASIMLYPVVFNDVTCCLEPGAPIRDVPLTSPAEDVVLSYGSYLAEIQREDGPVIRFPVALENGSQKRIHVILPESIPDGTAYIPGGAVLLGGKQSPLLKTYEVTLEPYFISKYEVTNRMYIEFWKSLQTEREKTEYMSRILFSRGSRIPQNAWNHQGRLISQLDLDKPVVGITREAATAFCEWYGRRLGRPCRLPTADEWELAARGTDQRLYPWGNTFETQHAFTKENSQAVLQYRQMARPGQFPRDVSPYGVVDMAGNVREWTSSDFPDEAEGFPQIKGASFSTTRRYLPLERADDTEMSPSDVGFRFVLPLLDTDCYVPPSSDTASH